MSKVLRKRRQHTGFAGLDHEALEWLRGEDNWFHLLDVPPTPGLGERGFDYAAFWREHSATIVGEHVVTRPGTRPERWWEYDAPERRRRVGGIGEPRRACFSRWTRGIPETREWIRVDDPDFHPQTLSWAAPIDPQDPPAYESEATFIKRHSLFLPGEEARLSDADFAPETIKIENPWYRFNGVPKNRDDPIQ